jgi:hypothetical protein
MTEEYLNPASPYGPIAEQEFEMAADHHKEELEAWLNLLPELSDEDFFWRAASAIAGSALAERFKGNWNHEHCKATAAYTEARRRHVEDGHLEDCSGDTIYSQAFVQAWTEQGHDPDAYPPQPCNCGAEE